VPPVVPPPDVKPIESVKVVPPEPPKPVESVKFVPPECIMGSELVIDSVG
jgi:hypothetical protein